MAITIELPSAIEEELRSEEGDLAAVSKEALLIELYREGRISHGELADVLGLSRNQADEVLRRRRVTEDLLTSTELAEQVTGLRRLLGQ
jgi:predicted HTH domain antitoxin